MATTFNWLYLGSTAAVLDPTEGNTLAEGAALLVGQTYGSPADPLFTHVTSATVNDLGGTAGVIDQDNAVSNDTFTTDIGAGPTTLTFDASVIYNATITYVNGTTATITAVIVQDTAGNLFLAPEITANADSTAMQALPIRSLTLNSVNGDTFSGMTADRFVTGFDDGVVDGTAGADLIDTGYVEPATSGSDRVDGNDAVLPGTVGNDDLIRAGAGNDTVHAGLGNDTVDGGTGNDLLFGDAGGDSLLGGAGNDTIHGDTPPATATQEHLSWIAQGGNGTNLAGGFTQDTGGMNVTATFVNNGGNTGIATSTTTQFTGGGPFAANSGVLLQGGAGPNVTNTLTFNAEAGSGLSSSVSNVSFRINDVDAGGWRDVITITAFDVNGNPVSVTITPSGNDTVSGNTVTAGNGGDQASSAGGSVLVTIPGPVHSVQISYSNSGGSSQSLWLTDVHFTTIPGTPAAGNDTIDGGDGADLILAEGGDDTIRLTGTFGNDTITGGETGETAGDLIDASNLTQNTTLSFTGNEAGTLSDGTSTASFSEIERFTLGSGNDTVNAAAATGGVTVDAGAGADLITGGSGNDTLTGGAGANSIAGGAGDDEIHLGAGDGEDDVIDINNGDGSDIVFDFVAPTDNGDGTFTAFDRLDVSNLTDAQGNPVNIGDVTVTDTNGDGTGDAILTFPGGESITLVGVLPAQVDSGAELHALGIPCFTRGTRIATPQGERAIETLRAGDKVWTLDHGSQVIRWAGSRRVAAIGALAPILIPAGCLGNSRDLRVSPQHRMLIGGWQAELLFSSHEVLVAACHLVDGRRIRPVAGGEVEYFHILFDRHEIVLAEGAPSESLHPGEQALGALDAVARGEVLALFPELAGATAGPGRPTARRVLKAHEAAILMGGDRARDTQARRPAARRA